MHDWKQVLRVQLKIGDAAASPKLEDEIVAELASHLEELYEQSLAEGLSEKDAFALCAAQVQQAQGSLRQITRAKFKEGSMNYRTRTIWLPGLLTLTLSS